MGGGANSVPPAHTIPSADTPSTSAPSKRGIRVRVNSLGAAVMFKQKAAAPPEPGPSSKRPDPPKLKTRLRSGTWGNLETASSASSAYSLSAEHNNGSASATSLPLAAHSCTSQLTGADAVSAGRLASATLNASDQLDPPLAAGPNTGFNRRKLFGRSNSIRSLFGGGGGASSANSSSLNGPASSPSEIGSSTVSKAAPGASHPFGLLRRMGSKSFLNVNQPKPDAATNVSCDDLTSVPSTDSHSSRRFSDSLKGKGRNRGKSVSAEAGKARSISSQSSSEAYAGRMIQSEMLSNYSSSKKSMESARSGRSIVSPEPHPRPLEADSTEAKSQSGSDAQEQSASVPRRLSGWLYNMVGSDNTPSTIEGGPSLSPVKEAEALELHPSSQTLPWKHSPGALRSTAVPTTGADIRAPASSTPTMPTSALPRSKAGTLFQTLANVGSNRATRSANTSMGDNTASGPGSNNHGNIGPANAGSNTNNSASGSGATGANNGWVPSGVGFDRAFKIFMDTGSGSKDDEGIWLLGVWHGPRQPGSLSRTDGSSEAATHPLHAPAPGTSAPKKVAADHQSEDGVGGATRTASPASSKSASSPRQSPTGLIHASSTSSTPGHNRVSSSFSKETSRVGSSVSTAATTSTSGSLRTMSSATSSNVGTQSFAPIAADTQSAFQPDFASRIWCTYRSQFAPISRDGTISEQAASAAQLAAAHSQSAATTPLVGSPPSHPSEPNAPPASANRTWLGRKVTESDTTQEAAMQAASPLGLGAALGAGYTNAPSSLGEKMGITNLWSRATAAAQAAGFGRAGLTTDSGWGCMLRTGQSLLANALINVHLGRSWLRDAPPMRQLHFFEELAGLALDASAEKESISEWREKRARHATYIKILSWFLDDPSPACPFGVHRMAREGKRLGKEVGEWFGPSTAAGAIKQLVSEFPEAGIAVELAHDGVFYLDEVRAAGRSQSPASPSQQRGKARCAAPSLDGRRGQGVAWHRPVLVLIGIRLGLDSVNPIYYDSVKATFSFPHSVGIAGGRPSSSYYFMGHQGNSLFYLDPHNVHPAVPLRYPPSTFPAAVPLHLDVAHRFALHDKDDEEEWWSHAYSEAQTSTFHCEKVRRMPIKSLDPSMLLGFLVKDEEDLADLCARIKALPKTIFSFAESAPKWVDDDDFDPSMESFSEPSVGEESESDLEKDKEGGLGGELGNEGKFLQQPNDNTGAHSGPVLAADDASPGNRDEMIGESQQRTAEWLDRNQWNGSPSRATYANAGSSVGIAFPSLDLLSPQTAGHTPQRPARSDARQVSTSSAATTRPSRRENIVTYPEDPAKRRGSPASSATGIARANSTSPSRSPTNAGADESFSTVHHSDSEVGSGWEEVSDGGTIAPSGSTGAALLPTDPAISAEGTEQTWTTGATGATGTTPSGRGGAENPLPSAFSSAEGDLVGVGIHTPTNQAPGTATRSLQEDQVSTSKDRPLISFPTEPNALNDPVASHESASPGQGGSYFGLTSAHTPLTLPRRRSQSKASPAAFSASTTDNAVPPPVPAIVDTHDPSARGGPSLEDSDDDF